MPVRGCLFFCPQVSNGLILRQVGQRRTVILGAELVCLRKNRLTEMFGVVILRNTAAVAVAAVEVVAQRGNVFLDLRCAANGAGVGRLALVGAVGLLCDSACIPNVLVGNGQVFNVLGYAAGFAGAVNAASVLAGGGGGLFFPVVADGGNVVGLGFV